MSAPPPPSKEVTIDYTNWRGERKKRRVRPLTGMQFTKNQYHPEPQWLFQAVDLEDGNKVKLFAMRGLHGWE